MAAKDTEKTDTSSKEKVVSTKPTIETPEKNYWNKTIDFFGKNAKAFIAIIIVIVVVYLIFGGKDESEKRKSAESETPATTVIQSVTVQQPTVIQTKKINFPLNGVKYLLEISDEFPSEPNFEWEQYQSVRFGPKVDVEIKDLNGNLYHAGPGKDISLPTGVVTFYVRCKSTKSGKLSAEFRQI